LFPFKNILHLARIDGNAILGGNMTKKRYFLFSGNIRFRGYLGNFSGWWCWWGFYVFLFA
jgi:hypothetical protein